MIHRDLYRSYNESQCGLYIGELPLRMGTFELYPFINGILDMTVVGDLSAI